MNTKETLFFDLLEEHFFIFQLDTGCSLYIKNFDYLPSEKSSLLDGFEFEVLSTSGKPIAVYKALPKNRNIQLLKNISIDEDTQKIIFQSFLKFFRKVELKSIFIA